MKGNTVNILNSERNMQSNILRREFEIVEGSFYEKELQKTKNTTGEYIIEKIIKTRNDKLFVEWRGYNNSFNSWIDKNNIIKYT